MALGQEAAWGEAARRRLGAVCTYSLATSASTRNGLPLPF